MMPYRILILRIRMIAFICVLITLPNRVNTLPEDKIDLEKEVSGVKIFASRGRNA